MLIRAEDYKSCLLLSADIILKNALYSVINWTICLFDSTRPDDKSSTRHKKTLDKKNKLHGKNSEDNDRQGICCANCHALLTHSQQATAIDGKHRHIVTNPMGQTFNIAMYRQVDCQTESSAESEFSWFSGFAWRVISCPSCRQHIGWSYQHGDSPDFYGLITDKLIDFNK